jgi:hypothetical protein
VLRASAHIASPDVTTPLSSLKLGFLVFSVAEVHPDSAVGRARGSRGAGLGSRPTKPCRLEVELGVQRHAHNLFKEVG